MTVNHPEMALVTLWLGIILWRQGDKFDACGFIIFSAVHAVFTIRYLVLGR